MQIAPRLQHFLHHVGAKSGANEVQFAHVFAPTWLQTRCNLHMFSHLHGAHEVHSEEVAHMKCKLHALLHLQVQTSSADDVQHIHVLSK